MQTRLYRRYLAVAATAAAVTMVAGCGGGSKPSASKSPSSTATTRSSGLSSRTVHVGGTLTLSGTNGVQPTDLRVTLNRVADPVPVASSDPSIPAQPAGTGMRFVGVELTGTGIGRGATNVGQVVLGDDLKLIGSDGNTYQLDISAYSQPATAYCPASADTGMIAVAGGQTTVQCADFSLPTDVKPARMTLMVGDGSGPTANGTWLIP